MKTVEEKLNFLVLLHCYIRQHVNMERILSLHQQQIKTGADQKYGEIYLSTG